MKRKRVTISQVAQAAGVSPTAVSFAFNNPDQVGQETAERIRTVARELGYFPNPIARAMVAQRIGVVGVLVPFTISGSFANPFIAAFMQGVGEVCDQHSLGALIVSPYENSLELAARRAPVDGFLVLGFNEDHNEIEPLQKQRVPFVIVDGDAETVSEVNVDDESGAYAAADYLLKNGHRDISFVTFQTPNQTHMDDIFYGVGGRRLAGYRRAFQDHGLELNLERMVQSETSVTGGNAAFHQIWQSGLRPTAVLALSDAMALGVIQAAVQLKLDVPGDLEVIGFDDIPIAALTCPALSTVHQPIIEKGRIAASLLVAALDGNERPEKVKLSTRLLLRESTRTGGD